jgi:hypothetical protein
MRQLFEIELLIILTALRPVERLTRQNESGPQSMDGKVGTDAFLDARSVLDGGYSAQRRLPGLGKDKVVPVPNASVMAPGLLIGFQTPYQH